MNIIHISGNLTRDVETRYLPSGTAIGAFGIASNRKWRDQTTKEMKEEVTFVDITVFGKQAETVAQYFKKGSPILITGRLKLDQWDDKKTGDKRSKLGIVMEQFEFMGGKKSEQSAPSKPTAPATETKAEDDDVPF